jgi:UDP-N-acetylmuramoyl-L-alanyl-D-glutamate--2,6-diaminopimelate ligase
MANPKKIVRTILPKQAVTLAEKSYRESRGLFWQARYGFPARKMHVIAVTGTNGKTTTASYISAALKANDFRVAVYTTAYYDINGTVTPNRNHMTVTSQADVQQFFSKAHKAGVDYVVLEVTSHALDQRRTVGVPVEVAVMTNLTQDHLDYHGTMEKYALAKARLLSEEYNPKHIILNHDDEWYSFFKERSIVEPITYGLDEKATLQLTHNDSSDSGSSFTARVKGKHLAGTTQLIGLFNIYNAMAAISVGMALNLDMDKTLKGVASLASVPGRMESIDEGQDFAVLVDFSITPDALLNALTTLRDITPGKVRIVFGATGDRDPTKRPIMGEVVGRNADAIYLTDDETYTEDPKTIRDAVYEGIKKVKAQSKTQVFDDRFNAIMQSFRDAKKGDTVLLAGIGHEDYRNMGGKKLAWDEREVARNCLTSLDK